MLATVRGVRGIVAPCSYNIGERIMRLKGRITKIDEKIIITDETGVWLRRQSDPPHFHGNATVLSQHVVATKRITVGQEIVLN